MSWKNTALVFPRSPTQHGLFVCRQPEFPRQQCFTSIYRNTSHFRRFRYLFCIRINTDRQTTCLPEQHFQRTEGAAAFQPPAFVTSSRILLILSFWLSVHLRQKRTIHSPSKCKDSRIISEPTIWIGEINRQLFSEINSQKMKTVGLYWVVFRSAMVRKRHRLKMFHDAGIGAASDPQAGWFDAIS
jgi:hypothetical protein